MSILNVKCDVVITDQSSVFMGSTLTSVTNHTVQPVASEHMTWLTPHSRRGFRWLQIPRFTNVWNGILIIRKQAPAAHVMCKYPLPVQLHFAKWLHIGTPHTHLSEVTLVSHCPKSVWSHS